MVCVSYALTARKSHLKLKEEQQQVTQAVFSGRDGFVAKWLWQEHMLPFLIGHELGLIGSQKKSCVVIVSPLIALMVDQVRSLGRG